MISVVLYARRSDRDRASYFSKIRKQNANPTRLLIIDEETDEKIRRQSGFTGR